MRLFIKNGNLIDPANDIDGHYDVLIENGVVADVQARGSLGKVDSADVIDAHGKWVVPGLVDLHVHLREPGFEWKETIKSGSSAAVLGGYTTVCCMPNTKPVNDCAEVTKFIIQKSKEVGLARVLPIGAVSIGLQGKTLAPLSELRIAGCVAFSDDGEPIYNAGMMRRALEWVSMLDAPICCHEEDKSLSCGGSMNESGLSARLGLLGWPKVAEEVMIARDIELARTTGSKTHICHVSTARGVELIRRAKNDGIPITAEVTPHHLCLTEEAVSDYQANSKMSPPLRESEDCIALQAGLKDGAIDCIASDHAPHELDSKNVEFSKATFGIIGLQTSLPLILDFVRSGLITKKTAFKILSYGPAKILNAGFGSLKKGAPADIAIIDPDKSWMFDASTLVSLSANSPFIGKELRGIAESVIVEGKVVVRNGQLVLAGGNL
jgi:dihydroorotase